MAGKKSSKLFLIAAKLLFLGLGFSPGAYASGYSCDKYLAGGAEWKLIRDLLPKIFKSEGDPAVVDQVTDPEALKRLLILKLKEEVREFSDNPSAEEMADIREVLKAIEIHFAIDPHEVAEIQEKKSRAKGGFQKGFVMRTSTEDRR